MAIGSAGRAVTRIGRQRCRDRIFDPEPRTQRLRPPRDTIKGKRVHRKALGREQELAIPTLAQLRFASGLRDLASVILPCRYTEAARRLKLRHCFYGPILRPWPASHRSPPGLQPGWQQAHHGLFT